MTRWLCMGPWKIWRGQARIGGTRDQAGRWWPNGLIIVRSLETTFVTSTNFTTTTIVVIILFLWRGLGQQSIGLAVAMLNSWYWQRSMQITYRGTWLMWRTSSLSWIFGVSWAERWLRIPWTKRKRLAGSREDGQDQGGGPWGTISLWRLQNIVGNGLRRRTNGGGLSRHIISNYAPTPVVTVNILQGGITSAPKDSSFVMSVIQLMLLMLIPKNEIST